MAFQTTIRVLLAIKTLEGDYYQRRRSLFKIGGAKVPRSLSKDFVKHTFTIMQEPKTAKQKIHKI